MAGSRGAAPHAHLSRCPGCHRVSLKFRVFIIAVCLTLSAHPGVASGRDRRTGSAQSTLLEAGRGAGGGGAGGKTAGDYEACAGCKFVWEKAHSLLDESAGYEAAKDAFERVCANVPDVFFDSCDAMFDQEDAMVQDYLQGTGFSGMCSSAKLCA